MIHRQVRTPSRTACAALLALVLAAACQPSPRPPDEQPAKAAPALRPAIQPQGPPEFAATNDPDLVKLKEALLEGTAEALIPYFERPDIMAPGGRLTPYDSAYLRGEGEGGTAPVKPVREILREPVAVLATRQPDGAWIAVFIPESKREALRSAEFLETGWLADYFACRVDRRGGKVRIVQNFCFNETDGPYPASD